MEEEGRKGGRYGRKSLEEKVEDVVGDVDDGEDPSTVIGKRERSSGRGGRGGVGRVGDEGGEEGRRGGTGADMLLNLCSGTRFGLVGSAAKDASRGVHHARALVELVERGEPNARRRLFSPRSLGGGDEVGEKKWYRSGEAT